LLDLWLHKAFKKKTADIMCRRERSFLLLSARSLLVDSLRKELLGPREGVFEVIQYNPRGEYVLGVLEPASYVRAPLEYYRSADLRIGDDEIKEEDDVADPDVDNAAFGFDLDPRALAKSMGLSFVTSAEGSPLVDVLATWARYEIHERKKWKRVPDHIIMRKVDVRRNHEWEKEGLRIVLRSNITSDEDYYVSIYLVNDTHLDDGNRVKTEDLVFQPQIRVNCCKGGTLVPIRGERFGEEEEARLSLLYLNRPTLARGHLCSAVWKEIDPERPFGDCDEKHLPDPFAFTDAEILAGPEKKCFTNPDVRTEYLPCHSIEQVRFYPTKDYSDLPELKAGQLSEAWEPETIEAVFDPIASAYSRWISDREAEVDDLPRPYRDVAMRLLAGCRQSLRRIEEGLNLLKDDEDLRLSFCFMNKVMDTQALWKRNEPLSWRLFQIAFILQNVPSIARKDHPDRTICDVLWFATAGGKTEAYLGLLVLALALRRRRGRKRTDGGGGTAVISRYTLRMLTIQQFRRALVAIVACDYLRSTGWRPRRYSRVESNLWGTGRFSIGLWVGGEVTPNHLLDHKRFNPRTYRSEYFLGALGRLRGYDIYREKGYKVIRTTRNEPAQVLSCPVCRSILSIPEKRVLPTGTYEINWIVSSRSRPDVPENIDGLGFKAIKMKLEALPNPKYYTFSVTFSTSWPVGARDVDNWWKKKIRAKLGRIVREAFARPSRPGYFIRKWDVTKEDVDFEIHCPNPLCKLNTVEWTERIQGLDEKSLVTQPLEPFSVPGKRGISHSIPISAFVVDDQVYHRCPSLIVATVDKFARLPFQPKAGSIFGNVDRYDSCWGFYREVVPPETGRLHKGEVISIRGFERPELIIQDELHLIEGPLGSMVGIYESAIEELASTREGDSYIRPKYVASSATIQKAKPHVRAVFDRSIAIFPPSGISVEDNFFSHSREAHPLDSSYPGRLYIGLCAPGRGPHTPTIRVWASLLQKAFELRELRGDHDPEADQFWTLVGYFNALRELASASSLYKIDIVERLRQTNASPRPLEPALELSSRMDSSEIPVALNQLTKFPGNVVDAVLATSMFGTGVDVDRLGLMVVHGQPKTTANYIQATGRVGRQMGGLVVGFLRSTRPRDLDHYEFFVGYHRCLHKYVEPITANPFAPRARERALGPVMVSLLRNARTIDGVVVDPGWSFEEVYTGSRRRVPASGSRAIRNRRKAKETEKLTDILEKRSQSQPRGRQPKRGDCAIEAESLLDRWKAAADLYHDLMYAESTMTREPQYPVVLGDAQHETHDLPIVFEKTPQSLREVEPTTRFQG